MAYEAPTLKWEDYIYIVVDTKSVSDHLKHLEDMIHINLMMLYRQVADSTIKRIRKNVSGPQPYGTGKGESPPIVRRQGRVYDTIGYRSQKTSEGPHVIMGAIKGDQFGRQLAKVHEEGKVIHARGPYLIFPPQYSPARSIATGEQIMTATETRRFFYAQWDTDKAIMIKRTKSDSPELAFIKAPSVKIPGRHIISRELAHVESELLRKLDTTIQTSLRLETLRIY